MHHIMDQSIKLFVTVGTQMFPFGRLINALNELVDKGLYKPEEIVMQATVYPVIPKFTHYTVIPMEDFNHLLDTAEVIITHSGENTIIATMERHRPFLIVPRLKENGEHVDDHQLEIASIMEEKYDAIVVKDISKLPEAIEKAKTHKYKPWVSHTAELVAYLKSII